MSTVIAVVGTIFYVIWSIIKWIFKIVFSILSFPIKLFLGKRITEERSIEDRQIVKNDAPNVPTAKGFSIRSEVNVEYRRARFDEGVVYAQTPYGEVLIGYYDEERAYDENNGEIASFKVDDEDVFIQFNKLGRIKKIRDMYSKLIEETDDNVKIEYYRSTCRQQEQALLTFMHANASKKGGCIEDVRTGDYLAFLEPRSSNNDEITIIGMAAAFACLQNFVNSNENEFSQFYMP